MISQKKIHVSIAVFLLGVFVLLFVFAGNGKKNGEAQQPDAVQAQDAQTNEDAAQTEKERREEEAFFKDVEGYDPNKAVGRDTVDIEEPTCDFDDWIGQKADQSALMALDRPFRILPPDAMYTQDYMPDRINVHTDENGIIVKVDCG